MEADLGQISLVVTGTTVGTKTFNADVSTQDSGRIIAAFGARYGIVPNSAENVTAILQKWFKDTIDTARADVLAYERQQAALAAEAAVQIIDTTFTGP